MSDPVVPAAASVFVEAAVTGVVEVAPAPAPAPLLDFGDTSALLKFALTKIAEVELQGEVAVDDKIKQIVETLKTEIRKADVSPSVRVAALDWCDDALPHVIKAVDFVKAEIKKAALAEVAKVEGAALEEVKKVQEVAVAKVKKCCPSFFTKKV
jgi:hypothetical protein